MQNISDYKTLVFDCDGVILNSNKIKTQAFFDTVKHYGQKEAQDLVDYHVENGGVSRYKKFAYFFTEILKIDIEETIFNKLLNSFSVNVKQGLMRCDVAEGLSELRVRTKHARWLIVSGGDQIELNEVFTARGLDKYFDGGVFGSPDTKEEILEREKYCHNITQPSLFLGDSKYDYKVAKEFGLDFLFISQWTEIFEWNEWCQINNLEQVRSIRIILN